MRTAAKPIPPISPEVELRLWANIERLPGGIWAWLGTRNTPHRAVVFIGGGIYAVNRVVWVLKQRFTDPNYQIPDGLDVCHRNDVTRELYDCNPDNLWLGTHAENMRDKIAKNRGNHAIGNRNGRRTKPDRWPAGDRHHFRLHPELICRGEDNGGAKLSWAEVREIRSLYAAGGVTYRELGARFGITKGATYNIVAIRTWKKEGGEPAAVAQLPAEEAGL